MCGNSEIGAHIRGNLCCFIGLRHLNRSRAVTNRIFSPHKVIFSFVRAQHVLNKCTWSLLLMVILTSTALKRYIFIQWAMHASDVWMYWMVDWWVVGYIVVDFSYKSILPRRHFSISWIEMITCLHCLFIYFSLLSTFYQPRDRIPPTPPPQSRFGLLKEYIYNKL